LSDLLTTGWWLFGQDSSTLQALWTVVSVKKGPPICSSDVHTDTRLRSQPLHIVDYNNHCPIGLGSYNLDVRTYRLSLQSFPLLYSSL
jgi:hypothetical protein